MFEESVSFEGISMVDPMEPLTGVCAGCYFKILADEVNKQYVVQMKYQNMSEIARNNIEIIMEAYGSRIDGYISCEIKESYVELRLSSETSTPIRSCEFAVNSLASELNDEKCISDCESNENLEKSENDIEADNSNVARTVIYFALGVIIVIIIGILYACFCR